MLYIHIEITEHLFKVEHTNIKVKSAPQNFQELLSKTLSYTIQKKKLYDCKDNVKKE